MKATRVLPRAGKARSIEIAAVEQHFDVSLSNFSEFSTGHGSNGFDCSFNVRKFSPAARGTLTSTVIKSQYETLHDAVARTLRFL